MVDIDSDDITDDGWVDVAKLKSTPLPCSECKHFSYSLSEWFWHPFSAVNRYRYAKCVRNASDNQRVNLVSGTLVKPDNSLFCSSQRRYPTQCGPLGAQWVPKHKKGLFKLLSKKDVA